jgi:magnesium transporter
MDKTSFRGLFLSLRHSRRRLSLNRKTPHDSIRLKLTIERNQQTHVTEYSLARKLAALSPESSVPPSPTAQAANPSSLVTGVTEEITTTERTPLLNLDRKITIASVVSSGDYFGRLESPSITRTRLLIAISYASFSGIISGMCLLFAKSGVELLLLTVRGQNQFWRWESWMLLFALCVFALLQLWYLHKGLVLADPTLVCPCECL